MRYTYTVNGFGREYRATLSKNVEMGASLNRGMRRSNGWEAFATFGYEGFNKPGFETEEQAQMAAEEWVMAQIKAAEEATRELILSRLRGE
jgi:hypothetical protein